MSDAVRSSVSAADWLPVHQRLVEGVAHALSNRVAALMGVTQLLELRLASLEEGARTLGGEVTQLREQVNLLRALSAAAVERREPIRVGDAVRLAAAVLAQDRDVRMHEFVMAEESPDAPPLLLWRADHLRLGVLLLLAASDAAKERVTVHVRSGAGAQGSVQIVATTPLSGETLQRSPSYAVLARMVAAEGGKISSAAAPEGTTALELSLPGLAGGSARSET